ncbi:hypothetical protein KQX54_014561 [Cotesia glomerata]|uniref:Uncharacterized protein n=1 Tax=Cotesia glomerata TaxID=32391 RepID=A0AAV7I9K0_COTGL|nr:hypothetical protein KQX54_014561 [Cotesia glomerata]
MRGNFYGRFNRNDRRQSFKRKNNDNFEGTGAKKREFNDKRGRGQFKNQPKQTKRAKAGEPKTNKGNVLFTNTIPNYDYACNVINNMNDGLNKYESEFDHDNWLIIFTDENSSQESLKTEGESKRRRGRPRKNVTNENTNETSDCIIDKELDTLKGIKMSNNDENESKLLFATRLNDDHDNKIENVEDETYYALLAGINKDPTSYKQAMETNDAARSKEAIDTSKDQIADIFTKPLPFNLHQRLTERIMNGTK